MMDELHPALARVLTRHYETQRMSSDRVLTKDAEVQLDECLYSLCLRFSDVSFAVYAIFPTLAIRNDRYDWALCNV